MSSCCPASGRGEASEVRTESPAADGGASGVCTEKFGSFSPCTAAPRGPEVSCGKCGSEQSGGRAPVLAPEVVQSALAAGIPVEHLREMNSILKSKSRRLDELPRQRPAVKKRAVPLSESEEAEEEAAWDLEEAEDLGVSGAPSGGGEKMSDMELAIMKLTAIASKLSCPQDKPKLENLLDGGGGAAAGSESSGATGSRKNAAAMRALQKCLVEDPKYLYKLTKANVQSDFIARPVQPGEPI